MTHSERLETVSTIETIGRFVHERYRGIRMPPPEAAPDDERTTMFRELPIQVTSCARDKSSPSLRNEGFTLVEHVPKAENFYKKAHVVALFHDCVELCKQLTECVNSKVIYYQYRQSHMDTEAPAPESQHVRVDPYETLFHIDITPFSEFSFDKLVEGRHFQVLTFWRTSDCSSNIESMPLALCDTRSVNDDDIVLAQYYAQNERRKIGQSYRLIHNESQRWCYFPSMTPEEMLVSKQYDTLEPDRNRRSVFHGAIPVKSGMGSPPLRRTIEVRVLALFEEETNKLSRIKRFQANHPE